MLVAQWKLGFAVIKTPLGAFPVTLGVACSALLIQRSFVLVVLFMTGVALLRRFLEHRRFVAGFALSICVFSQQWKAGLFMVELGGLFPAPLAVATGAVLA
jgi:hypothetical protein